MKFIASSNENTIVTVSEFLEDSWTFVERTIKQNVYLIILDDETLEEVVVMHGSEFYAE